MDTMELPKDAVGDKPEEELLWDELSSDIFFLYLLKIYREILFTISKKLPQH